MPATGDTAARARHAAQALQHLVVEHEQRLHGSVCALRRAAAMVSRELERREVTDALAAELEAAGTDVQQALAGACDETGLALDHVETALAAVTERKVQP